MNPGPLEDQLVILTTEPSLQPPEKPFNIITNTTKNVPALRKQRQENQEFRVILEYTTSMKPVWALRLCLRIKKQTNKQKTKLG